MYLTISTINIIQIEKIVCSNTYLFMDRYYNKIYSHYYYNRMFNLNNLKYFGHDYSKIRFIFKRYSTLEYKKIHGQTEIF